MHPIVSAVFLFIKKHGLIMNWMLLCKGFSIVLPLGMRRDIIRQHRIWHSDWKKKSVLSPLHGNIQSDLQMLLVVWCKSLSNKKGKGSSPVHYSMWKQELLPFTPDRSPLEGLLFHCSIRHVIWDLWTMLFNVLSQSLLLFQYHDYSVCY